MNWMLISVCILAAVIAIVAAAIAPGRISDEVKVNARAFYGLNFAHRGLHTKDMSIPENSMSAFIAARDGGYGIELDVHLTADGEAVVFHDYDLGRACGVDKKIASVTYEELSNCRLFGTDEHIPLLSEALQAIDDTPVIVEIKPVGAKNKQLCKKVYEVLCEHGKNFCIQGFDPRSCRWFKKNAPEILRGQLVCRPREYAGISTPSAILVGNLLLNFLSRPHYIAHKSGRPALLSRLCMLMKPMKAVWTVTSGDDITKAERENDIVIFEHYNPPPKFK